MPDIEFGAITPDAHATWQEISWNVIVSAVNKT
jgi:hypothetical protein